MTLRGIVVAGELVENPPDSGRVELLLRVQGVGAGQPRRFVVPFEILVADESLDPDHVAGNSFLAEIEPDEASPGRWVALRIKTAASRALRPSDDA